MDNTTPICSICGMPDSLVQTEDVHYCNECNAIEQKFIFVDRVQGLPKNLVVDEEGFIYHENEEISQGIIGCLI